jgi:hypothetical protein
MPRLKTFAGPLVGAALTLATLTPLADAQQPPAKKTEEAARMPSPKKADDPPTLWAYFAVFLILAAVFGANMIPSKRGHQD